MKKGHQPVQITQEDEVSHKQMGDYTKGAVTKIHKPCNEEGEMSSSTDGEGGKGGTPPITIKMCEKGHS